MILNTQKSNLPKYRKLLLQSWFFYTSVNVAPKVLFDIY